MILGTNRLKSEAHNVIMCWVACKIVYGNNNFCLTRKNQGCLCLGQILWLETRTNDNICSDETYLIIESSDKHISNLLYT